MLCKQIYAVHHGYQYEQDKYKKKPDTVKKIINARPVEYNEEKKTLIQFSLYKSTIKLINL